MFGMGLKWIYHAIEMGEDEALMRRMMTTNLSGLTDAERAIEWYKARYAAERLLEDPVEMAAHRDRIRNRIEQFNDALTALSRQPAQHAPKAGKEG